MWHNGNINITVSFPGPPLLRRALNPAISPQRKTPRGLVTSARVIIPHCGETPGWVSSRSHLDSLWPGFLLYTRTIPGPSRTNLLPLARRSLERCQSAGATVYKHYLQRTICDSLFTKLNNIYEKSFFRASDVGLMGTSVKGKKKNWILNINHFLTCI